MTDLFSRSQAFLSPALAFVTDIHAVKAEGVWITAADGKRYLDFSSGLAVANIGHNHPAVVAAAKAQIDSFIHTSDVYRTEPMVALAERIGTIAPPGLASCFFSNSGAEVVDGAVKLARFVTGRQGIVAFTGAFHGRTLGAVSLTTSNVKYRRRSHPLLPAVYHADFPYCYRCPVSRDRDACGLECRADLERIFKTVIPPEEVAAVVIEPIQGEGGYVPAPAEYLKYLRETCDRHGIMLVFDEIQCGMGRTGRFFACQGADVVPDVLLIAKGIASGFPLSVIAAPRETMEKWLPGAHGTTFGGNPVACAAALATIGVIERERLLDRAASLGRRAAGRLVELSRRFSVIGDVRGPGLMIGIEFVKADGSPAPEACRKVRAACEERGLVLIDCGRDKHVIRFIPPLVTTDAEMDQALDIFQKALDDAA
ncbi:MAG: aspartate aminotransferase family protein [Nitrospirae bacterium]|nr:aspartate aminotransferase family protein [Nitrospirota bacterium]